MQWLVTMCYRIDVPSYDIRSLLLRGCCLYTRKISRNLGGLRGRGRRGTFVRCLSLVRWDRVGIVRGLPIGCSSGLGQISVPCSETPRWFRLRSRKPLEFYQVFGGDILRSGGGTSVLPLGLRRSLGRALRDHSRRAFA